MKDFQEFVELIDPDEYRTVITSARTAMANTNKHREEDAAFFIAIELLKRYHTWINQN